MTRYRDYVPLFSGAEGPYVNRICSSCDQYVGGNRLAAHVEREHKDAEARGDIIELNGQWWRKRGT